MRQGAVKVGRFGAKNAQGAVGHDGPRTQPWLHRVSCLVVTVSKFADGAWLTVLALPLLMPAFATVHRA
ncbi:hypothetical protein E4K10_05865 [Streptomyces sp. T1317-0309]|nr:hypothetical protein E4K10_05865 [Streptomyces sp. T1317-0309]